MSKQIRNTLSQSAFLALFASACFEPSVPDIGPEPLLFPAVAEGDWAFRVRSAEAFGACGGMDQAYIGALLPMQLGRGPADEVWIGLEGLILTGAQSGATLSAEGDFGGDRSEPGDPGEPIEMLPYSDDVTCLCVEEGGGSVVDGEESGESEGGESEAGEAEGGSAPGDAGEPAEGEEPGHTGGGCGEPDGREDGDDWGAPVEEGCEDEPDPREDPCDCAESEDPRLEVQFEADLRHAEAMVGSILVMSVVEGRTCVIEAEFDAAFLGAPIDMPIGIAVAGPAEATPSQR
jgi:hypothetical protein